MRNMYEKGEIEKMIRFVGQYLRVGDWYDSKVPFLMCYLLCSYLLYPNMRTQQFILIFSVSFLFVFLFLAFGYLINDYCDRESDKKAGKHKIIFTLNERTVQISFVLVIAWAAIPIWIYSDFSFGMLGAEVVTFLLGASYSMPPFRFKEKGVWGLIISSFAQRCMPLLVLCQVVPIDGRLFILFFVLSFIIGLRYIFVHQVIDLDNDREAGVCTFARRYYGVAVAGIYICFLLELMGMICLLVILEQRLLWYMLPICILLEVVQCRAVRECMGQSIFLTFACMPLEAFGNIYFPIMLTYCVGVREGGIIWLILIAESAYLLIPFVKKIRMAVTCMKVRIRRVFDDSMGTVVELCQDFFMCVALSVTIAILNCQISEISEVVFSLLQSFVINWVVGFLLQVYKLSCGFAGLFGVEEQGIVYRALRNILLILIYLPIIGVSMYLVKIPDVSIAMQIFGEQFMILYVIAFIAVFLMEPISVKIAAKVTGRRKQRNDGE